MLSLNDAFSFLVKKLRESLFQSSTKVVKKILLGQAFLQLLGHRSNDKALVATKEKVSKLI